MSVLLATSLKYSLIIIGYVHIRGFTVGLDSTVRSKHICRRIIRNISNRQPIHLLGANGRATITVQAILSSHKVEQQGYRSCMAFLKLADKYGIARLEDACAKALSYTPRLNFQSIKTILTSGQDRMNAQESPTLDANSASHGFTRGADYYGRK